MDRQVEPHEQRVIDEFTELSSKIDKLSDFVSNSPIFSKLAILESNLLLEQLEYMKQYAKVLNQRIRIFKTK